MPTLPPIVQNIVADPTAYVAGMQGATRANARFDSAVVGTTAALTTLGVVASAVAAGLATDFDREMTRIETLVGVARDQVDAWRQDMVSLAGDVGRGPRELARSMFVVTSAGERGAEALDIVQGSAKAAAVGLGDTATIARTVTAAMQAWAGENLEAEAALDVLLTTVREGNLEAESLAGSLGKVMGIAATMGVTFAEVGAFMATFTRLGVDANLASTSLRGTLAGLLNPTDKTREALAQLGLTADDVRKKIREDGLTATLIELIQATEGNFDAIGNLIPNVRALSGVLGTAGVQAESYVAITASITDSAGALEEAFQRVKDTPAQSLNELKAEAEAAMIVFGTALLPVLDSVVTVLADIASVALAAGRAFGALPGPIRDAAVALALLTTAGFAFHAIAVKLGPVLVALKGHVVALAYANNFLAASMWVLRGSMGLFIAPAAVLAGAVAIGGALAALGEDAELAGEQVKELGEELKALELPEMTAEATKKALNEVLEIRAKIGARLQEQREELNRLTEEGLDVPPNVDAAAAAQLTEAAIRQAREEIALLETQAADADAKIKALGQATAGFNDRAGEAPAKVAKWTDAYKEFTASMVEQIIEINGGERALLAYQLRLDKATEEEIQLAVAIWDEVEAQKAAKEAREEAIKVLDRFKDKDKQARGEITQSARKRHEEAETLKQEMQEFADEQYFAKLIEEGRLVTNSIERLSEGFAEAFLSISTDLDNTGEAFKQLADTILEELARIAAQELIVRQISAAFRGLLISIPGAPTGALSPASIAAGITPPGLAAGGHVGPGQFAVVGEMGPELIQGPAQVTPMHRAMQQGVTVQQNITFSPNFIDGAHGRAWLETEGRPAIQRVMRDSLRDSQMASRAVRKGRL